MKNLLKIFFGIIGVIMQNTPEMIVSNLEKWLNLFGFYNFPDFMHTRLFVTISSWFFRLVVLYCIADLIWSAYKYWKNKKFQKQKYEEQEEYLSLQDAAQLLSDETKLSKDLLRWIPEFGETDFLESYFFERDNPDKIHKETLSETTIQFVNLCLYLCKKNNVEIYGKEPSSSTLKEISFGKIFYFDSEYEKLYSDISRDGTKLIFTEISIKKEALLYALKETNIEYLIEELNASNVA